MHSFFKNLIRFYKVFLSPFIGGFAYGGCRFYPTCSSYALEALDRLPLGTALWRIVQRLARCQPFYSGEDTALPPNPSSDSLRINRSLRSDGPSESDPSDTRSLSGRLLGTSLWGFLEVPL